MGEHPLPKRKTLGGPPLRPHQKADAHSSLWVYEIKAQPAGNLWRQIPACTDMALFERLLLALLGTLILTIEGNQALVALATKQQQTATALPVAPPPLRKAPLWIGSVEPIHKCAQYPRIVSSQGSS
ncbi:hypothetical protein DSO57_1005513 [Entomophthora muscae]|uniref:Uncharacterized protein n=1 Tax=Entomophthora muscae TaxID=34485 RepID=A0ACC2SWW7_9FUNG|nr:hypothetical protein DSO57_1005513 [Entomophthora muscae]